MSDKALRMLKHMRKQILRQPAPYVVVRGAAISIGVDPGGSECDGLVKELLRDGHLQRYPPAPALPRTVCTDLPTWAYPQPTRDSPGSLRQTLRRAYRGPGGASSYGGDGTMNEKREERTKEMAEELSRLQQIHAHLAALEQMAASYPENHSTRLAIESLELYKARTVVEGDIVTLRGSLGYGTTGYGTL